MMGHLQRKLQQILNHPLPKLLLRTVQLLLEKGKPVGLLSSALVTEYLKKLDRAQCIAALQYKKMKEESNSAKLANGVMDKIIFNSVLQVGLSEDNVQFICHKTIINRVARNNLEGYGGSLSQSSPMREIEPILAEFCRHLNRMAKSITQKECLELANDIIKDTPTSDRVKEFHKTICGLETSSNEQKRLGKKYFYNFMTRHSDIIHTTKVSK
jgi:hypothetical protein